jgi:hypothetical protein
MDSSIANILVALIGASASIAVALITLRATSDAHPKSTSNFSTKDSTAGATPESFAGRQRFRTSAWALVGLVYVMALICFIISVPKLQSAYDRVGSVASGNQQMELIFYYVLEWGVIYGIGGVILFFIGFWAQRRLTNAK